MASLGGLQSLLGGLEEKTKKALNELLIAWVPNSRIGPVGTAKAENFLAYKLTSTTASDTAEFSIAHGLNSAPYLALPIMDLSSSGATFPQLTNARAADARRIYFRAAAGSTNQRFSIFVE